MVPKQAGETLRIRRYDNRKLYDVAARRYVTLEELRARIRAGADVRAEDHKTGEDLTQMLLAQLLLEGVRDKTALIPRVVLLRLVRLGAAAPKASAPRPELTARAREEAERIVAGLVAKGRLPVDEALALRQEISEAAQRLAGEAQRGLEGAVHGLLERAERETGVGRSLEYLKEKLLTLETYLAPRERRKTKTNRRRR